MSGYQSQNIKKNTANGSVVPTEVTESPNFIIKGGQTHANVADKQVDASIQLVYDLLITKEQREEETNYIQLVNLEDPSTGIKNKVSKDGCLLVSQIPLSPEDTIPKTLQRTRNFITRLANSAGSTNLNVNGSTTSVNFELTPVKTKIRKINQIRLIFNSSNMKIDGSESRRFGPISSPGLTNGLEFSFSSNNNIINLFQSNVVLIGDFYEYATIGGIINDVDGISAGVDFLMIIVNLQEPIILFPGTSDYIRMKIQDDLSGIQSFKIDLYGSETDYDPLIAKRE